jgi:M6 family metalloprotease-like protein
MVKNYLFILCLGALSLLARDVFAVTAVPWLVEKTQPDGTVISVYLRGDEQVHWMESKDGYTLMYDDQKYVVYARLDADGNMVPSNVRYGNKAAQSSSPRGLRYSKDQVEALKRIWEMTSGSGRQRNQGQQRAGATVGERKALCVLVGFEDRAFGKAKGDYETLFNQLDLFQSDPETRGSVRDFFRENSYGQLDFTVTVVGPYEAPNTTRYYADQNNYREFAAFAATAADAEVDYNDFADEGVLETFHILFAGFGDEAIGTGMQIWSHKWQLAAPVMLDGVQISVYSCSPELRGSSGNNITYIGVVCHELSHVFGSPDYYDTGYAGYPGTGNWDLMAGGSWNDNGRQPAHINMFQKMRYGWVNPEALTEQKTITGMPPSALHPVAYTIQANDNGELYVLDNKQKAGFDESLPGHGLLIWHVHPAALGGSGSNSGHPQQLYPVVASSATAIPTSTPASYGAVDSPGAPFPGTSANTSFTHSSTPAMFTWAGLQPIAKPVTGIVEAEDGTISFRFLDGPTDPVADLTATVTDNDVRLNWTPPARNDIQGYKIFRDGALQFSTNNKHTATYTQIGVLKGDYEYCVSVVYEATESAKVCIPVAVTTGSDEFYLPVSGLQAIAGVGDVRLNWTAPFTGGWTGIAGDPHGAYYFGFEWDFFAGTLWNPSDLKGLGGYEISKVRFVPIEDLAGGATYAVAIYEVPASGDPVLLHTQDVAGALDYEVYNEITLSSPVAIDATKGVIIGMQVHTIGGNCLPYSQGDSYPGRNVFYDEDGWVPLEEVGVSPGRNYCMQVYLDGGGGSSVMPDPNMPANTSFLKKESNRKLIVGKPFANDGLSQAPSTVAIYHVYRDGEEVGTSTTTSYTDADAGLTVATIYTYCVTVEYADGGLSEGACIETKTDTPYKPVSNLKAKVVSNEIDLSWESLAAYTIVFEEDFENGIPATWGNEDVDGDSYRWGIISSPQTTPQSGNSVATSASYLNEGYLALTPDNWLVTPAITLTGNNVLKYYVGAQDASASAEHYGVYISASNEVPGTFAKLWEETMTASPGQPADNPVPGAFRSGGPQYIPGAWYERTIDLSEYNGQTVYIAFRHFDCTDKFHLNIDNIKILAPFDAGAITYNVYEGEVKLANGLTSPQYAMTGIEPGTHTYCVTAVYNDENESEAACVAATVVPLGHLHRPVYGLKAAITAPFRGELTWNAPVFAQKLRHHTYDSGTHAGMAINGMNIDVDVAARWTPGELEGVGRLMLSKVRFVPLASKSVITYSVRVWVGGSNPSEGVYDAGQMVVDQLIPAHTAEEWNEVVLDTPVPIDPEQEIWIGLRLELPAGGNAVSLQNEHTLNGIGNLILWNGTWAPVTDILSTLTGNWIIDGVAAYHQGLDPTAPLPALNDKPNRTSGETLSASEGGTADSFIEQLPTLPVVAKYLITRNGEAFGETTETTFVDEVTAAATHTYCVQVVYDNAGVSGFTCTELTHVLTHLSIAAASIETKIYDGTTEATVTSVTFNDGANDLSLTLDKDFRATAGFSNPNAGTGKTVTLTVTMLNEACVLNEPTFELTNQRIIKAIPDPAVPILNALTGQTLYDLALPQGWRWDVPLTTVVGALGTHLFPATYTPDDLVNYEIVAGRLVEVIVTATQAYNITITPSANGSIASGKPFAEENSLVTLTALPDEGYEVDEVTVTKAGDNDTSIETSGSGLIYTFTMPAYAVAVQTIFRKGDVLLLEELKEQLEESAYTVSQAVANTSVQVTGWLVQNINNQLRSSGVSISAADVAMEAFTAAVAGTAAAPAGISGSFAFTVSLALNEATLQTARIDGAITPVTYTPPATEVFYSLNIPDVEGLIVNWRTGVHAVSEHTYVRLTFQCADGYSAEGLHVYANGAAQTLTTNGNGSFELTLGYLAEDIVLTVKGVEKTGYVGIMDPSGSGALRAVRGDGGLYVYGLKPGATFHIYNVSGLLCYQGKAIEAEQFIPLREHGFYIIVSDGSSIKATL